MGGWIMFKTVRAKITVCFSVAIMILFLLFGITGYRVLRDYLIQMQQENQTRLAQSLCTSITFFKQSCENLAFELLGTEDIVWRLDEVAAENHYIKNIYVIDKTYDTIGTGDTKKVRTYLIDRISTAERYEGNVIWDSGYDTQSMMLFGKCQFEEETENSCYLFLQIDNSHILDLFHQFRLQNSQRFSLKGITNSFEVTEQGFFYNYYDNYKELLHTEITMDDWYLRTWSDKALIMGPAKGLLGQMVKVLIAALAASLFLSAVLAFWITRPIKGIKETMEHYGKGDFTFKARVSGKDEIADLGNLLNQMAAQIFKLFERVKEEEEQSRRLELQTLVYQINPHFLYNTLDSVNILARQSGNLRVAEIVTDLSRLFRLGLHQGREAVTVRDELMHVTYYLKIQKIRFDEQLSWELKVPAEIMEYEIIKFILQPIVENAIYHGVKGRDEPGHIRVTACEKEEFLMFSVVDTGNGMNPHALEQLKKRLRAERIDDVKQKGFGIWNVNQRIKLCYGESCGIEVESWEGEGTKVSIRILKHRKA